jgi:hypothetical protein
VNAAIKPNIAQATPGYDVLPPNDPPAPSPPKPAVAPTAAAAAKTN